jgi:hypothetical protein
MHHVALVFRACHIALLDIIFGLSALLLLLCAILDFDRVMLRFLTVLLYCRRFARALCRGSSVSWVTGPSSVGRLALPPLLWWCPPTATCSKFSSTWGGGCGAAGSDGTTSSCDKEFLENPDRALVGCDDDRDNLRGLNSCADETPASFSLSKMQLVQKGTKG